MTIVGTTPTGNRQLVAGDASGDVLVLRDGLSFWGGVDPDSGVIIDAHHPSRGACITGKILMLPTSRGSCSGSGVLLELALNGRAPAAILFSENEEILTLGALVADLIFDCGLPVLRLSADGFREIASRPRATLNSGRLYADGIDLPVPSIGASDLQLSDRDTHVLNGSAGKAAQLAMEIIVRMAATQGADHLLDVTRGHIDGCILAHSANLIFAETLLKMGAKVAIPTTINAISVDRRAWQSQGLDDQFGDRASRLADAYVKMGAQPTFTCSPYLLDDKPVKGECLGWSESNAVIYANSVLGARTTKHPDYFDLFVAITGRAPAVGVYFDKGRVPQIILSVDVPEHADESLWPLLGWLAGKAAPDRIPLLLGLERLSPSTDDLKGFCAAFGSTSGAPMFHIAGVTPEADMAPVETATMARIGRAEFGSGWHELNSGDTQVDLVAIGSPHASLVELDRLANAFDGAKVHPEVDVIVTVGRKILSEARRLGHVSRLEHAGVRVFPDICWCSITEPVFPTRARALITNSGKYAHYATGLTGRTARFGTLQACVNAALTGRTPDQPPTWVT